MVTANVVSAATITTGFVSYLQIYIYVPSWLGAVVLVGALSAIAVIGMRQSTLFMTATTTVGALTLVAELIATRDELLAAPGQVLDAAKSLDGAAIGELIAAAVLVVYCFIGSGDMAMTSEETKKVSKTLPGGIVISLIIVFVFYLLVSLGSGPTQAIAEAEAPIVKAVERVGWPGWAIGIPSLFIVMNGALTQIIAASRLLCDLGRDERGAPLFFGTVWDTTSTPVPATIAVGTTVAVLATFVPLRTLAEITSLVILIVFAAVNASLFALKRRSQPAEVPDVWRIVPIVGGVTCIAAALAQTWQVFFSGG